MFWVCLFVYLCLFGVCSICLFCFVVGLIVDLISFADGFLGGFVVIFVVYLVGIWWLSLRFVVILFLVCLMCLLGLFAISVGGVWCFVVLVLFDVLGYNKQTWRVWLLLIVLELWCYDWFWFGLCVFVLVLIDKLFVLDWVYCSIICWVCWVVTVLDLVLIACLNYFRCLVFDIVCLLLVVICLGCYIAGVWCLGFNYLGMLFTVWVWWLFILFVLFDCICFVVVLLCICLGLHWCVTVFWWVWWVSDVVCVTSCLCVWVLTFLWTVCWLLWFWLFVV